MIEIGPVKFEQSVLHKQLKNDLKDDWFPDPLKFNDIFDSGYIKTAIVNNFDKHHGQYIPSIRDLLNIPKPNFTLRYALETGVSDRALYHGLASFLARRFDKLIPWYVFSHRVDPHKEDERYLFRRGVGAWKDFVEATKSAISSDCWLLSTDLTNYFENINLNRLRVTLLHSIPDLPVSAAEKGEVRAHIGLLFECLQSWSYAPEKGLPQNRDASSFLANMYMRQVDVVLRKEGYEYFRYMDDIKIICKDEASARRALKILSIELRGLDLSVNSKKTKIVSGKDGGGINECLDIGSSEIERLDSMWKTRNRGVVTLSFPLLQQLTIETLKSRNVDSREFRYCIGRMSLLASCEEFSVPPAYFSEVTDLVVKAISDFPAATDQFAKYLRSVPLSPAHLGSISAHLMDNSRNFYTWQSYRLWLLLSSLGYINKDLSNYSVRVVENDSDGMNRAGASVYVGSVIGGAEREVVAKRFGTLKSFIGQRSALIAVHELSFKPHIKDFVAPWVRPDLVGVYRLLQKTKGTYFVPPEKISILKIVDEERDYA